MAETTDTVGAVRMTPDAAVVLRYPNSTTHFYLIEVDRGTEPISKRKGSSVLKHLENYDTYISSSRWKERYGADSRIVLFVTTTEERREHIRREGYSCNARLHKLFLFSTLEQVKSGFFNKVWKTRDFPDHSTRGLAERW